MIDGLQYLPNFVSKAEETRLTKQIDGQIWMTDLKRRVQHYGYIYDYKKRNVTPDMALGGLPSWLETIAVRVQAAGLIDAVPDQVIINEYTPGQGISAHVDCEPCFGDTILSLSLGSTCCMDFRHIESSMKYLQVLESRSLLVMTGTARYDWQHAIAGRKSDLIDGVRIQRKRRLSLTLRKVILDAN